jgi:low affinity Fe/Cu permease
MNGGKMNLQKYELNNSKMNLGKKKQDFFTHFASQTAHLSGSSATFTIASGLIILWAMTGPLFKFSDTWQLVINTSTTIVTFLMVFLIQNTQNRDSQALHLKLDALIVASRRANNILVEMEDMSQEELDAMKKKFAEIAEKENAQIDPKILDECIESSSEARNNKNLESK